MTVGYVSISAPTFKQVNRFWSKTKIQPNGCWEWQPPLNARGYGYFYPVRKSGIFAHRFSYRVYYDKDPIGFCVCHKCDNPKCVNPFHLFLGTDKENMQDRKRKGRGGYLKGIKNGRAKLTEQDIADIQRVRKESGYAYRIIAERYGVSITTVRSIATGQTWKHL